jgi:hypothetical protein
MTASCWFITRVLSGLVVSRMRTSLLLRLIIKGVANGGEGNVGDGHALGPGVSLDGALHV